MTSVDTNVLVRYLIDDDDPQHARAVAFFEKNQVFVPVTVVLESEWVLRAPYRLSPETIMTGFRGLAGVDTVTLQSRSEVLMAAAWCLSRMDFADALHLATSQAAAGMVSFDRAFVRRSRGVSPIQVSGL